MWLRFRLTSFGMKNGLESKSHPLLPSPPKKDESGTFWKISLKFLRSIMGHFMYESSPAPPPSGAQTFWTLSKLITMFEKYKTSSVSVDLWNCFQLHIEKRWKTSTGVHSGDNKRMREQSCSWSSKSSEDTQKQSGWTQSKVVFIEFFFSRKTYNLSISKKFYGEIRTVISIAFLKIRNRFKSHFFFVFFFLLFSMSAFEKERDLPRVISTWTISRWGSGRDSEVCQGRGLWSKAWN